MKKVRRVLILCRSVFIAEIKKSHKIGNDDDVCFFPSYDYAVALAWLIMEDQKPDLILVDLEARDFPSDFFMQDAKKSAPKANVMGVYPSQKNEP